MGEDQDPARLRGLYEPQRRDGLAGAGSVLEPEPLGRVRVLPLLREGARQPLFADQLVLDLVRQLLLVRELPFSRQRDLLLELGLVGELVLLRELVLLGELPRELVLAGQVVLVLLIIGSG